LSNRSARDIQIAIRQEGQQSWGVQKRRDGSKRRGDNDPITSCGASPAWRGRTGYGRTHAI